MSWTRSPAALNTGTALCAMSSRKAWPVGTAPTRLIGASMLPSTKSPLLMTTIGMPLGPRSNMPYWSVASSGTLL
ncbi:hypothetical protein D3C73_555690 [compost metagenome]